jgi:thioredoxin 1
MSTSEKKVITVFESREHFFNLLKVNPGLVVIKLGATWCGPCKKIAHVVEAFFATSPPEVICADIDVDESFDLYSMFKGKRMVNGIPTILCYRKGNTTMIPDDSVVGIQPNDLDAFFKRCGKLLATVKTPQNIVRVN